MSCHRLTKRGDKKMSNSQRRYYRYSNCFKRMVVEELKSGISVSALSAKYGIKGNGTVRRWAEALGYGDKLNKIVYVKMKSEGDELQRLREENRRLKISLADAVLARDMLESLVEVVNEVYHTDVKKNFGVRAYSGGKRTKQGGGKA
jgi:transposase-like protein